MDALDRFQKIIQNCTFHMWFCGVDVLKKDFKWLNIRLTFTLALTAAFFNNSVYTCYTNDFEVTMQWLSMFSITTQGLPKLWVVFKNRQDLEDIVNEIMELFNYGLQRRHQAITFPATLERCGKVLWAMYWGYVLLAALSVFIIVAYPVLMYCLDGGLQFVIPLFFPFLDRTTTIGYGITFAYHLIAVLIVVNFTIAIDILFFTAVAGYAMQVERLSEMNEELNDFLQSTEHLRHERGWGDKVKCSMVEIVKIHHNIQHLIGRLNNMFFLPITYQMATAVGSLSISLFLMIKSTWYVVYAIMIASSVQLLLFSVLGEGINVKNQHLANYVYAIKWNLMPVSEQMLLLILLTNSQKPKGLTIAGLHPLNMETFVAIFKNIYSIFMVLMETI